MIQSKDQDREDVAQPSRQTKAPLAKVEPSAGKGDEGKGERTEGAVGDSNRSTDHGGGEIAKKAPLPKIASNDGQVQAAIELDKLKKKELSAARDLCSKALSDEPGVRQAALETLEAMNPRLGKLVTTLTVDDSFSNRESAITALQSMKGEAVPAIPVLIWLARKNENHGVIERLISAMAQIGPNDRDAVMAIIKHGTSPVTETGRRSSSYRERVAAFSALGTLGNTDARLRKAIVECLEDALANHVEISTDEGGLGRGRYKDYLVSDPNGPLVNILKSIKAFGKDAQRSVPLLRKLKLDRDQHVRQFAAEALEAVQK